MTGEIIILQPHLPLSLQPLSPPLLPFCSRKCCSSKGSGCLKIKQTNTENTTVPSAKASLPDLTPGVFQLFLLFLSITLRLCLKLKITSFNLLLWSSFSSPRDKLCPKRMEISWMLSSHTERFPFVMYLLLETSCQAMEALLFSPCFACHPVTLVYLSTFQSPDGCPCSPCSPRDAAFRRRWLLCFH